MSEKKHKGGYELLKEKYNKVKAEKAELENAIKKANVAHLEFSRQTREDLKTVERNRDEWMKSAKSWEKIANDNQRTIEQQGAKISQLSADLHLAQTALHDAELEHQRQLADMRNHMGFFHRLLWDWKHAPQFTDEDHWHN